MKVGKPKSDPQERPDFCFQQISTGERNGHHSLCRQRQVVSRRKSGHRWLTPASPGHGRSTRTDPRCHRRTLVSTTDQTGARSEVDQHRLPTAPAGCCSCRCRLSRLRPRKWTRKLGTYLARPST